MMMSAGRRAVRSRSGTARREPRPRRRHVGARLGILAQHDHERDHGGRERPERGQRRDIARLAARDPLASTLAITLAGMRISRRTAGYIATLTSFASFAAAVVALTIMLRRGSRVARPRDDVVDVARQRASTTSASRCSSTSLSIIMMLIVSGVGSLIVAYSVGYMEGEDEERRYFAYMSLFLFSMLLLVEGGQPPAAARRLGHGRALELPADRLPPASPVGDRRREEGVRDERCRRRDDRTRALPAHPAHRADSTTPASSRRHRTAAASPT